jgi:RNA polymerase sigma-70 factor (ECF subfamily)
MTTPTRGARALKRIPARQRSDSDAVEVALATSGDSRAFERLYRSHVGRIHALTRRMLSPDEADDATQDAFIRAWQKLESFRGESAFGTWLHKIAVNVCLGRRAQLGQARERYHADDAPLETVAHPHTGGALDRVDFETALERLPDGARQVLVLHDVEGYRHEEIAEMLGTVTGTSKSQLHRARMALRQHLER